MSGYVYLLRMDDTDYYKVGVSSGAITERITMLQIGNPIELHLIAMSEQEQPYQVERDMHNALKEYRVRNEWFKVDREIIQRVFRDYTTMASLDTLLQDDVPVVSEPKIALRLKEKRQKEPAIPTAWPYDKKIGVLRAMRAAGITRNSARERLGHIGQGFDNDDWTEAA